MAAELNVAFADLLAMPAVYVEELLTVNEAWQQWQAYVRQQEIQKHLNQG